MREVSKALLDAAESAKPLKMFPCVVTQISPLLITLLGETDIPAQKVSGLVYSLGTASALLSSPGTPLVIPTQALGA